MDTSSAVVTAPPPTATPWLANANPPAMIHTNVPPLLPVFASQLAPNNPRAATPGPRSLSPGSPIPRFVEIRPPDLAPPSNASWSIEVPESVAHPPTFARQALPSSRPVPIPQAGPDAAPTERVSATTPPLINPLCPRPVPPYLDSPLLLDTTSWPIHPSPPGPTAPPSTLQTFDPLGNIEASALDYVSDLMSRPICLCKMPFEPDCKVPGTCEFSSPAYGTHCNVCTVRLS